MTPEEWHRIKEVLETAVEIEPHSRGRFLDSACAGEASVRREVESLLDAHDEDTGFLEHPVSINAAHLAVGPASEAWIGRHLGSYELLEEVGAGRMGTLRNRLVRSELIGKQRLDQWRGCFRFRDRSSLIGAFTDLELSVAPSFLCRTSVACDS